MFIDGALVDTELDLWELTWNKIVKFLPSLQDELFPKAAESDHLVFAQHPTLPISTTTTTTTTTATTPAQQQQRRDDQRGNTVVWESGEEGGLGRQPTSALRTVGLNI